MLRTNSVRYDYSLIALILLVATIQHIYEAVSAPTTIRIILAAIYSIGLIATINMWKRDQRIS
jgi:hypothetical protein